MAMIYNLTKSCRMRTSTKSTKIPLILRVFPKEEDDEGLLFSIFFFFQGWPPSILPQTGQQFFNLKPPLADVVKSSIKF